MNELKERIYEGSVEDQVSLLNKTGLFSQPVTKEILKESEKKSPLYKIHEFSKSELIRAFKRVAQEAIAIGGMPKNHSEVFSKRGWLLPFLFAYDELLWGRWDYWFDIIDKGTIDGSGPIPQIEWCDNPTYTHQVKKMLEDCLNFVAYEGATIDEFADWLLWGLAATKEPPKISAKVNEHWYRKFDLHLILRYPKDYMSNLLEQASSRGYKSALGYFSTPFQVTQMMNKMLFETGDSEKLKRQSFNEPCCGCGAMMLPASNYCLFGYGQDVSPIAVKLCIVQMYWYAPWFAINPLSKDL